MQDHPLDIEALLAQRRWLRDLARGLARTEADADDLAQGALSLALARPLDAVRAPRAWLASLARHLAARTGRAETARTSRERAYSRSVLTDATDQAVANTEVYRLLSELVLALDEPYRATVMLRYYEGLSAAEIARQSGVPASTVRTRLERGLAQLRAALEARDPKARWLASLAPVALASDGTRRVAIVAGFVALLGAAGAGLSALRGGEPRVPSVPATPTDLVQADRSETELQTPLVQPAPMDTRDVAAEPDSPPDAAASVEAPAELPAVSTPALLAGTLEVLVTVDGKPRAEGLVILDDARPGGRGWPNMELQPGGAHGGREHRLDDHGRVRFEGVRAGTWWLAISATIGHVQQFTCEMPEGEGRSVEVQLTSGAVYGNAYDDEGVPIADAWVALSPTVGQSNWQYTRTGVDGAYRMEFVRPGGTWVELIPGEEFRPERSIGPMQQLVVPRSGDLRHDFGEPGGLRTWRGRVVDRAGRPPVSKMSLHLQHAEDGRYVAIEVAAETGAFEQRLGRGTWSVKIDDRLNPVWRFGLMDLELAGADVESEVVLPWARLTVELSGALEPPPRYVSLRHPVGRGIMWRADTNGEHVWVFEGVQAGEWLLTISDRTATFAERLIVVREDDLTLREPVVLPPR